MAKAAGTAATLDEVALLAGRLPTELGRPGVHPGVLSYCHKELLLRSLFHTVFEAMYRAAAGIDAAGRPGRIVTRLLLKGFRGWERLDLRPSGHVLLAARIDLITALASVLGPDAPRSPPLSYLHQQAGPLAPGPFGRDGYRSIAAGVLGPPG